MVAVDYEMQHTAHNERDLKRNMAHQHMNWTHLSQSLGPMASCYKLTAEPLDFTELGFCVYYLSNRNQFHEISTNFSQNTAIKLAWNFCAYGLVKYQLYTHD
jgi:hypothetical protein